MNKTKRVLSVVLAVLMLSSLIAALAIADEMYTVVINYIFEDNSKAAPEWVGTIYKGSALKRDVKSPEVVGYTPDKAEVSFNITAADHNVTETVTYSPAVVNYTVKHYQQNVDNDNYVLVETETKTGLTNSLISDNLKQKYDGFTALNYNTDVKIAADGSTIVEIKYDRNYYMLSLNLDGGFGVEPIYARYGAAITLGEPTKPGYKFDEWTPELPATMPVGGGTYAAKWTKQDSKYQIQYWQENADDDGYSYVESETVTAATGDVVNYNGNKSYAGFTRNTDKTDKNVTVKGDGSTVLNVYFDREVYTIYFISDTETENVLSCGKEEHTHIYTGKYKTGNIIKTTYYYGGCYPAGSNGSGGATKGNTICGKTEHSHNKRCYSEQDKVVATITAKYGAYIGDEWPTYNGSSTWATSNGGSTYQVNIDTMPLNGATFYGPLTSSSSETAYYYVEVIPGEDGTEHGGILYKEHHRDTSAGSGFSITDEDKYPITGFTFKEVKTKSGSGNAYDGATFYYTRNRNNLVFDDQYGTKVTEQLPYEQVLSESVNYKNNYQPAYPSTLEAGAYVFGGWYLDPSCTQLVDWNAKMPDAQVVVYAKWAPVVHTVTFAKTEGAAADATQYVNHNELAQNYTTTNGSYTFIGWFYKDANGVEHAFDLSMPVKHDMNLYAKWRTDVLVNYIIHYQLADGTKVADDTTGSAFVLETKTFEAKVGDALYADYAEGYFPDVPSHSIKMENNQANEFTFVYAPADKVTYTVKYLEKGTNTQLHTPKTVETTKAVVTEIFEPVKGYAVDEYQKRLILTAGEGAATNEITFWYTKDEIHAPVTIIHWTQNIEGEGYTQYQTSTEQGTIGNDYKAEWTTIEGFHKNEGKSNAEGKLEDYRGLVLNLYYDRDMITYTFHFVDSVTGDKIADDITGQARYGKTVSQEALRIDGYKLAEGTPELKAITVGTVSAANEFTFYYIGYFNVVHVKNSGTNKTTTEVDYTRSVIDNGYNLTAAVTPNYLYGGAFTNPDCDATHVQPFKPGETAISFTPERGKTYYIWEVSETYLKPRTYAVSKHLQEKNGQLCVVELYLMTHADRQEYQYMGFEIVGENAAISDRTVYEVVNATKGGNPYQQIYVNLNGDMAVSDTEVAATNRKAGYIAMYKLDTNQFATFKNSGLTFQPYWVTLDGIIVRGVNSRNCTYKRDGEPQINADNQARIGSNVGIYTNASQQTIDVAYSYVFEAADVEVVTPEVPETPEIPEVPEAPEMTLNSDAMYLRAQYTYEMMTNTVKFISAIDVNECIEYGFVINGEVVKCEDVAETVDGYNASYLFGGSVNGAMLMSCNMLLDGLVDGMTLNVTPYYVALDGTVVYGETRTLVYRQWVGLEG